MYLRSILVCCSAVVVALGQVISPSVAPSIAPTYSPSIAPTYSPSIAPTYSPSFQPSPTPNLNTLDISLIAVTVVVMIVSIVLFSYLYMKYRNHMSYYRRPIDELNNSGLVREAKVDPYIGVYLTPRS
jgi:hypothetical protein